MRSINDASLNELYSQWSKIFTDIENMLNKELRKDFGLIAIPMLEIISSNPENLLVKDQLLLNR